jgi:hypothetical protein
VICRRDQDGLFKDRLDPLALLNKGFFQLLLQLIDWDIQAQFVDCIRQQSHHQFTTHFQQLADFSLKSIP